MLKLVISNWARDIGCMAGNRRRMVASVCEELEAEFIKGCGELLLGKLVVKN